MNKPRKRSPYAGCEVKTRPDVGKSPFTGEDLGDQVFLVEDWWENVYGCSWMVADGNPAAMFYAVRSVTRGSVPFDNEVLYGKIDGMGFLFHVSELCLGED